MNMIASQPDLGQPVPVPAPIGGIVAEEIYGMDQRGGMDAAILMYNVIPGEYGCRVRPGYVENSTNIDASDASIRTIMHYNTPAGSMVKTFAATDEGIYDITAGGAGAHSKVVTWSSTGNDAGWCSYINFTNGAGSFLLVCDEDNGYVYYDGTSWTTSPSLSGSPSPNASSLVHVTEWQGRVWFVERETGDAWFLAALAISGAIVKLPVGDRFRVGGHLVCQATWTLDAGDGIDDKFVQISSEGDVLVWQGTNPSSAADLLLVGRWVVGAVPAGRRILSEWGGDVLIITTSGIIKISALLSANSTLSPNQYVTKNISRYFREQMALTSSVYGWSIALVPNESIAIVLIPQPTSSSRDPLQFVVNTATGSWTMFRGMDMVSMTKTATGFQFGTSTGTVMDFQGSLDAVNLAGDSSDPITYSWLSHYTSMGSPGAWKMPQLIRTHWVGSADPIFGVSARFDFSIEELLSSPSGTNSSASVWDTDLWGVGIWQGDNQPYTRMKGLSGIGHHVAVAFRGEAINDLTYVGGEMYVKQGGYL